VATRGDSRHVPRTVSGSLHQQGQATCSGSAHALNFGRDAIPEGLETMSGLTGFHALIRLIGIYKLSDTANNDVVTAKNRPDWIPVVLDVVLASALSSS
jgi:hypothetical protein